MTTSARRLDTTDLEARVKSMYEQVATEPHQGFHFKTGRGLAERLGYPLPTSTAFPQRRSTPSLASATSSTWPPSPRARPCST